MNILVWGLSGAFLVSLAGGFGLFLLPWTVLFILSGAALLRQILSDHRAGRDWLSSRPQWTLFLLCLTVYLSTFRWHGGDDIPGSLLPYSFLGHGTLTLDPFPEWAGRDNMRDLVRLVDGHWFSAYPVAPSILASPLYVLPVFFRVEPSDVFLHNLAKIAGASLTALSAVVVFRALQASCSRRWAAAVTLLYAFGSYSFSVSSQALYSHGPAQLGVALGVMGLASRPALPLVSGLGFGLAVVSREDSVFFAVAAGLYMLFHKRPWLPKFLAGFAVPVSLNLAYWLLCTGRLQPPYFDSQSGQFSTFSVEALVAMLLSPSRGMVFFFPAAAFGVWALRGAWRRPASGWMPYFAAACFAVWVFYGFRCSWTGGNTFGNRYFSVVCMVLALFCGEAEESVRGSPGLAWAWSVLFSFCVGVHAMGAYFNWPGAGWTLVQQQAQGWSLSQFPLMHLLTAQGALGALGVGPRIVAAVAMLAWGIPLSFWMRRFIRA
ncbi:MAG TPA: hypothetical protein DEB40_06510 [Elusimicrobia bacterium]|nr:hypothetical protein [Elusimicrobiota bacterium]HBT61379.1 hypothetical protein [Elusimicrobiota bacterium]